MCTISLQTAPNSAVETQTSLANNLYDFIQKTESKQQIEAKIKSYEEELHYLNDLIELFDSCGYATMAEDAVKRANRVSEKILVLKLEENKIERELLTFELENIRRD
jgi:hypothetical protein